VTAERRFDLLVAGELNPDILIVDPTSGPAFGQVETIVDAIFLAIGSSSAIAACGAARLGLRTAFVGVVGEDPFGYFMLRALEDAGIDVSGCRIDATIPTGATVIVSRGADRANMTAIGAIASLRTDDVPRDLLAAARHLHVGSTYLQPALAAGLPDLFEEARSLGLTTSFDCNWDASGTWDDRIDPLLRAADAFLPNLEEARRITGKTAAPAAATELIRRATDGREVGRPFTLAIKQGPAGAVAMRGTWEYEVAEAPVLPVEVVDTTGAGDSFDAGFLYGMLADWPLRDALELGVACGSLSCTGVGGQPPSRPSSWPVPRSPRRPLTETLDAPRDRHPEPVDRSALRRPPVRARRGEPTGDRDARRRGEGFNVARAAVALGAEVRSVALLAGRRRAGWPIGWPSGSSGSGPGPTARRGAASRSTRSATGPSPS
jgi:sugar/nucleoside kinase (ribokinase family)